jgi:hypothetical protein
MTLWVPWFMTVKKHIYTAIKLIFKDFFLEIYKIDLFVGILR